MPEIYSLQSIPPPPVVGNEKLFSFLMYPLDFANNPALAFTDQQNENSLQALIGSPSTRSG
jgi:hypothetical protein